MRWRMVLPAGALLLGVLAGCSQDAAKTVAPGLPALSVTPADGAAGVRLDAPIVLDFGTVADRAVVERSVRLLWEGAMNDSTCSEDSARVGEMTAMMADPGMMEHMIEAHSMPGRFEWSGDTRCVFVPEGLMAPDSRYMIVLGPEMAGMMGAEPMGGHRDGMSSEMALHFTTLSASGHDGHH